MNPFHRLEITLPHPCENHLQLHRSGLGVVAFRGSVTLAWTALPAVQLEVTEALAGAQTRWVRVSEGIEQYGGVAQLTLPAVQQQFFRLVGP